MKAKTLLIVALALPVSIVAQNTTFSIPVGSSHSIVREFKENIFIVYNTDGTDYSVSYADLAAGMVLSAQLPAADVTDFEIYNGTVYFCGTAYGTPVAGWFDIVDIFFYGGQIEFSILTNTTACTQYNPLTDYDQVTALKKIEVMPVSGSRPHLLMVGEAACSHMPGKVNRCIVDLYYDGTDWISAVSQAHDNIMYFDDIAVTDNFVVTAGHKHEAEGEYMLLFDRLTPPNANIFVQNISWLTGLCAPEFYMAGGVSQYNPATDEEFLIEHIDGDLFATVCHGTRYFGTTLYEGTVLNLYIASSSGMAVANRYMTPEHSNSYRGLKYNRKSNSLYLLPGQISTCPESYLEFVMDNAKPAVTGALQHTDLSLSAPSFTSLDASPLTLSPSIGQAILSGESNGHLHLWRHLLSGDDECHLESVLPLDNMMRDIGQTSYEIHFEVSVQPGLSTTPAIDLHELETICTGQ